jgi:hypothetical protein
LRDRRLANSRVLNIEIKLAKADFQIARQCASRTLARGLGRRVFRMLN